ncbi:MAG: hypothetical protein U0572_04060 [Phycisphaerales bacterium]
MTSDANDSRNGSAGNQSGDRVGELVDALVAGETDEVRFASPAEARRAADLLIVHGLLRAHAQGDQLHGERVVSSALNRIRSSAVQAAPRAFTLRRTFPIAAMLAIAAGFWAWYTITAEHRAVAGIVAAHHDHGFRRYELVVRRASDDAAANEVRGTYDVDGNGRSVVTLPLPTQSGQSRVVFGCSLPEWWIVTPNGAIERGVGRDVVERWVRAVAGDAPFPSLDETLATLERDYDVTVAAEPDGGDHYTAVRTVDNARIADRFELVVNRETRKVRRVLWSWAQPVGSIAKVTSVEGTIIERRPFPDDWFGPEPHLRPETDVNSPAR